MNLTSTLTQKGQITIPLDIRKILSLNPFDQLVFGVEEGKILATPVKDDILSLYGSVKAKSKKPLNFKKLRRQMIKDLASKALNEGRK